jgi:hypothetical protein
MKMIELYKTNVDERSSARMILNEIRETHPNSDPSFDLEDSAKVLRVEDSSGINSIKIEEIMQNHGFYLVSLL